MRRDSQRTGSAEGMTALAVLTAAALLVTACWNPFSPDEEPSGQVQYHDPVDSAYKVLENLQYAYQSRDLDHYLACFRDDFEFHLLEIDFDDYDGDGIVDEYWGLALEEQFHEAMFAQVASIDLTLSGSSQEPWSGDSTGQSLQLQRTFELKVYLDGAGTTGYRANGVALFICREDTVTGDWYVWQWWDQSDT